MFPPVYAIVDAELVGERALAVSEELVEAGVELIQYRDKKATPRRLFEICAALAVRLRGRAKFIVNDRADVSALCDAGGVHVGQEDLGVEDARAVCGARWVGISTHNSEQLSAALRTSADYIAVGPVFATTTKKNPDPVVGLEFVAQVRALTRKPIVAIGGISVDNAESVYRAGADSVAVIRDLMATGKPAVRAAEYLRIAAKVRSAQS
ncbi:MAG TPA: thiamine phosphate synthase [Candidatus Acidoferrales bacterium]|nr:thiamine phosphate synthase [Candidatus Acidoferrales bacterium]